MKKVIVVGGGFAGINLAKALSGSKHYDIIMIDKNNYNFFPPLLYQVSTAFIEASNISYPFRRLFNGSTNIHFYMATLVKVIPDMQTIVTDAGDLTYDYLILAMGTETNYFGNENIRIHALPLKTIDDALAMRNHILLQMESSVRSTSPTDKEKFSRIVIAGGGPTGVEIAGMLAEMVKNIGPKDYPEIQTGHTKIFLISGAARLLETMSIKSQQEAYETLDKLGVKIFLKTLVKDYVENKVLLSNEEIIDAATLIWTSGVIAREVNGIAKDSITKGRRILVDETNKVKDAKNIFAIGDQCFQNIDKNYPNGHPQLAQVAIQQGNLLAKNLKRLAENKTVKPFIYSNKGSMAIIAKYKAVVDLPKGFIKGFLAWLVWLFIHIIPIAGFRNKAKLAFNWLWSFITNNPTLRLIIRPGNKTKNI